MSILAKKLRNLEIHFKGLTVSIKKVALSFALAGILGATYAVAETDGAFVGVQAGYGDLKSNIDVTSPFNTTRNSNKLGATRNGILAGYKQFFTDNFGLRYYGVFEFGDDYRGEMKTGLMNTFSQQSYGVRTMSVNANVDMLYNFVSIPNLDFGAFLGIGLGYVNHTFKKAKMQVGRVSVSGFEDFKMGGFDLGINLGLKTQIAQNIGAELYSRFGLLEYKKYYLIRQLNATLKYEQTFKAKQPYQVGLRFTYSF